jgi:hypothetical protein
MIYEGPRKEKKIYKVVLILLVGLAVISGARKDLNQFLSLAQDVHAFADHWFGDMLATSRKASAAKGCQAEEQSVVATALDERFIILQRARYIALSDR